MRTFGSIRCVQWNKHEIGVQFDRIGDRAMFISLLDEFKVNFTTRYWHPYGWWVLPEGQYIDLQVFSQRHNLQITWRKSAN